MLHAVVAGKTQFAVAGTPFGDRSDSPAAFLALRRSLCGPIWNLLPVSGRDSDSLGRGMKCSR